VSTKALVQSRLAFIDALRGIAVVLMVQLHTSHGWVHLTARSGAVWQTAQFLGGLAAPMFLTLAGVSLGLRWASDARHARRPRFGDAIARALQLLALGYLLRLQMWFVDAGGYANRGAYLGQTLLLAAYAAFYFTLGRRRQVGPRDDHAAHRAHQAHQAHQAHDVPGARGRWAGVQAALLRLTDLHAPWTTAQWFAALAAASVLFALGLAQVAQHAPERLTGVLRVDILQCIGGSLALVSLAGGLLQGRFARLLPYCLLACAAAFVASWTRSWVPGPLPEPLAAYLGQWPAAPGKSVIGLFPLFPWVAYAAAGVALGLAWGRLAEARLERRVWQLAAVALAVALAIKESNPALYELLQSAPFLTQPLRVANRLAWVIAFAGLSVALCRWLRELAAPLETLGRASLLVYWLHLPFAFGVAASSISKSLDLRAWALGSLILIVAMWCAAALRIRLEHTGPRIVARAAAP
jgi:uncharacterized membrane protein